MDTLTTIHKNQLINEVQNASTIDHELKTYYVTLIERSAAATNGVSQEEKLQACSELTFAMLCILLQEKIATPISKTKLEIVTDCIRECKIQLTIAAGFLTFLFVMRPQLAAIVESVLK